MIAQKWVKMVFGLGELLWTGKGMFESQVSAGNDRKVWLDVELNETWLNYLSHLVVVKRFFGTCVAKRHRIPVVISLSFRVVLLMFERSSEFPGEERRCNIGLCSRYWSGGFFLVVISQETAVSGGSCGMESDNFCRLSLLSRSAIFNMKLWIYETHILRNEEINVKKILAVINATYAVAKRKPEKIRSFMSFIYS